MSPSTPTRRQALRTLGSSMLFPIAGCGAPGGEEDPTEEPDRSPSATETPTPSPTATPHELSRPTVDDVAVDVRVSQQRTDEHPARVDVTVENTGERDFALTGGFVAPFPLYSDEQADGHAVLILVPDETQYLHPKPDDAALVPDEPRNGCWSVEYDLVVNPIGTEARLSPGDATDRTYAVLGYKNEACFPPDTYRVSDPHRLTSIDLDRGRRDDRTVEMEFAFDLTITEDRTVSAETDQPTMGR